MDNNHIPEDLIRRYLDGSATEDEKALVEGWYLEELEKGRTTPDADKISRVHNRMRQSILEHAQGKPVRRLWPRIAAVASILLCCSVGLYLYQHQKPKPSLAQIAKHDILPGKNQATLTLSNGQKIILTASLNGKLAQQGNTVINASAQAVTYSAVPGETGPLAYNTITTVRGQESPVPLVLSDGTKVWLNAASSITYPVAFSGKERLVKITGEAYFEVVHNAKQPFRVEAGNQTIEDIGTAFDINAYDDEQVIRTTLLAGSVRVSKTSQSVILVPGQQAQTSNDNIKIKDADLEEVIAWKNGYFKFDNEDIQSIMRKVSRWYDVDIQYDGTIPAEEFGGKMSRYKDVSEVLDMLELTGSVHFKVEGRRIMVMQ